MPLPADHEVRTIPASAAALEVRAAVDPSAPIGFTGRAIVYGERTAIGNPLSWGFYEELAPGAAADAIRNDDVRFLQDHDPSLLLARSTSGTLRMTDAPGGVDVDADMAPTSYARDLALLLERGDVSGMSFGFRVIEDDWSTETVETSDGHTAEVEVRTLKRIGLFDVSVVTYPAYPTTTAGLRCAGTLDAYARHRDLPRSVVTALAEGRTPPVRTHHDLLRHHRNLGRLHGLS